MIAILQSVGPLLVGIGLLLIGNGLFGTFLSLRMSIEAFPAEVIGLVLSAYFAGFLLGSLFSGRMVTNVGHIRAFATFAALLTVSVLLQGLLVDPYFWLVMRVLGGFAMAGVFVVAESWLNDRATPELRGRILSMYMITNQASNGGGQLLLSVGDPRGTAHFLIAGALMAIALVPLSQSGRAGPPPAPRSRFGFRTLYAISPVGVVGCIAVGLANAAFYSLMPIYGREVGLDVDAIAQLMAAAIFGGMAAQWPIGRLSDRIDRRLVIVVVALGVALASAAIALLGGRSVAALLVLAALYGALSLSLYPVIVAHANDLMAAQDRIQASAGLLFAYSIGAIAGPMAATLLMDRIGDWALFAYSGAVGVLLAGFTLHRMRRRQPLPPDEREPFAVVVPQSTPAAGPLDPRTEGEVSDQLELDLRPGA